MTANPKFGIRGDFVDTLIEVVKLGGSDLQRAEEALAHVREMELKFTKFVAQLRESEKTH